jgi:hypothetical protein
LLFGDSATPIGLLRRAVAVHITGDFAPSILIAVPLMYEAASEARKQDIGEFLGSAKTAHRQPLRFSLLVEKFCEWLLGAQALVTTGPLVAD